MAVATVRAGDEIIATQRLAYADRDRFFADVQMRQARHQRARIQFIYMFFEHADGHHLAIQSQEFVHALSCSFLGGVRSGRHFLTPDICARTSKTTAKSCLASPIPRAAVKNSFAVAVVGNGTSNARPMSSASIMSFCIMFTSNSGSSGMPSTKGPRYLIIGEAIALLVSTSTATSRLIPLFSASNTPSQKANICTAKFRLVAIFMESARPLSPT